MDRAIVYRVMSILAEMGLSRPISPYFDFDPQHCCRDYGPHRLYEFAVLVRDDLERDEFVRDFRELLNKYDNISTIKVDFYGITEYPGTLKNFSTIYLTVATV